MDAVGIASHMAREHVDLRPRSQCLAQFGGFFGHGHKKAPRARPRQRPPDTRGSQSVGARLDHGGGFDGGARCRVKRAPVGGQGVQINGQRCGCHGIVVARRVPRSRPNRTARAWRLLCMDIFGNKKPRSFPPCLVLQQISLRNTLQGRGHTAPFAPPQKPTSSEPPCCHGLTRLPKRVNRPSKLNSTVPMGPWRCLPITTSALPCRRSISACHVAIFSSS